jgi:hypothetical protein
MKIEVLGPGCARCKQVYVEAEKAVAAAGRRDGDVVRFIHLMAGG